MNYSVNISKQYIQEITSKVLQKKIRQLEEGFKETLDSPIFIYEGTTRRKNGTIAKPVRNAIDTGNLKRSIVATFVKSGTGTIKFRKDYAAKVLSHASVDIVAFTLEKMRNR
jgi:hypothetical protein